MGKEYKVDDKVRVCSDREYGYSNFARGQAGTIAEIDLEYKLPYEVEAQSSGYTEWFAESELERIEEVVDRTFYLVDEFPPSENVIHFVLDNDAALVAYLKEAASRVHPVYFTIWEATLGNIVVDKT